MTLIFLDIAFCAAVDRWCDATASSAINRRHTARTMDHVFRHYVTTCAVIHDVILSANLSHVRWYGLVLRKDDDDWVKKCMEYEVEGPRPRGRPKRTWREVVREDCQARKLNQEDAMDRCKWRKVIKDVR